MDISIPPIIRRLRVKLRESITMLQLGLRFFEAQLYRRKSWVVERWQGQIDFTSAARIAIFTHYDRQGRVADYVRYYLEQLREAGFTILFVTNSPRLLADSVVELRNLCGLVIRRRNFGYDFGAYRDALREIQSFSNLECLILANDSVYGPFRPLAEVLRRADPQQADVWGINDSYDRCYHLQSYFLVFHRRALAADSLWQFWDRLLYVRSKRFVIRYYEVGLSRAAVSAGLKLRALCSYRELAASSLLALRQLPLATPGGRENIFHGDFLKFIYDMLEAGIPLNPSHFFWDRMLLQHGCPFLKRELLTLNPAKIPLVYNWETVVRQIGTYDTNLIITHLQQVLKNRCI